MAVQHDDNTTQESPDRGPQGDPSATVKPLLAGLAAVVVVVAIVAGVNALFDGDEKQAAKTSKPQATVTQTITPTPEATESESSGPAASESATDDKPAQKARAQLRIGPQQPRCMVPTPQLLSKSKIAFAGKVAEVDQQSGLVTINVKHWFAAEGFGGTDTIMVEAPVKTRESTLDLKPGRNYLIAAGKDATVSLCGFSGPQTPKLRKLYVAAFE